tara:strand:+ start:1806 stop:2984 length:1179 start_codon:yes stop_codon:yes gene_type:complete
MNINDAKFAIIHDWFLKKSFGGAEKVTLLLDEYLSKSYSKPDIFSLVTDIDKSNKNYLINKSIKTSLIQSLPFGKSNVQKYLPLLPFAIEQIDLNNYDLIISSSHAFSKGVITSPDQLHISYVHTPMRYAWDQMNIYLNESKLAQYGFEIPIRYILHYLRNWDFISSQRIDHIIANSTFTAKRIKKYWGLDSKIIFPPVDVERFKFNRIREDYYLSVNRLVPNKRIDLLVKAFNELGLPLIIIGEGPEKFKLKKISKSNIKFLGKLSNYQIENYMSKCRAFVYAGIEDFGIAPVEAMASGAPVIAYGKGGLLDTVNCISSLNKKIFPTGLLFKKQTTIDIVDTVKWFEEKNFWKEFNSEALNHYSKRFNHDNFTSKFNDFINKSFEKFKKNL